MEQSVFSPWQTATELLSCKDHNPVVVYKTDAIGRRMYFKQCQKCGLLISNALKHADIPDKDTARPYNEEIKRVKEDEIRTLAQELHKTHFKMQQDDFWEDYNEYLKSEQWRLKRQAVLKRDNYLCQACLVRPATQCHHLTYEHLGDEPLFDLTSVCGACHNKITKMDRERRNGRDA